MLTIPTTIAAILPLLATMLSSWLNDDHFRPGINALIALAAILLTATACEMLAGNVTGNVAASGGRVLRPKMREAVMKCKVASGQLLVASL